MTNNYTVCVSVEFERKILAFKCAKCFVDKIHSNAFIANIMAADYHFNEQVAICEYCAEDYNGAFNIASSDDFIKKIIDYRNEVSE